MTAPIPMRWDGDAMIPLPNFARQADGAYVIGEVYPMVPHEDRSRKSHDHYFVLVGEAWENLPEAMSGRWPTAEHLRKWALIRAGYRDERSIVCRSKKEANRLKAFIRPMDDYAVVLAQEAVVTVYTAKSQSMRAMGKRVFQESKDAVLGVLADLIGVEVSVLVHQQSAGGANNPARGLAA